MLVTQSTKAAVLECFVTEAHSVVQHVKKTYHTSPNCFQNHHRLSPFDNYTYLAVQHKSTAADPELVCKQSLA
jgi:hypothetical protein